MPLPVNHVNGTSKKSKKQTIALRTYDRHMTRAMSRDNYFFFRRDYVLSGVMTKYEALFFQDVINHYHAKGTVKKAVGERRYMLCTVEYLEKSLGWDHVTQSRLLRSLKRKGFLETKKLGCPPRRWVWLNIAAVEDEVDRWEGDDVDGIKTDTDDSMQTDTGDDMQTDTRRITDKEKRHRSAGDGVPPVNRTAGFFSNGRKASPAEQLATRLNALLMKHRKVMAKVNLAAWTAQMQKLINGVGAERAADLMSGYEKHFGDKYMPRAFSAKAFVEKAASIETQIANHENSYESGRHNDII
jgi:hypothetical protein